MKHIPLSLKLTFLLSFASLLIYAQKLPGVQKQNIWAPANIKIDGRAAEWGESLQAYNKATLVYYTLANDNEHIYLVVKAQYPSVIDKILRGGISFTINHTVDKKDNAAVMVIYPVLRGVDGNTVISLFNTRFGVHNTKGEDNSLNGLNQAIAAKSKAIGVAGIKEIPDEEISVYNDLGIKAVSKFDSPLVYVYELAIPLKYLALPDNGAGAFSYHIKINADNTMPKAVAPQPTMAGSAGLPPPPPPASTYFTATDFWATYTLAKK